MGFSVSEVPFARLAGPFRQLEDYSKDSTKDAESRSGVIRDLFEEAAPQLAPVIPAWISDKEPLIRARVALHLSRVEKTRQEEIASKLKTDSSPAVRRILASSLGKIDAPWTLPLLFELARDENKNVADEAKRILLVAKAGELAFLPSSLRTREAQLGMMDFYLSGDRRWKGRAKEILIRWGMLDVPLPSSLAQKYGDPADAELTVDTVRRKVARFLGEGRADGLAIEELYPLYKILEEIRMGRLTETIERKLAKTASSSLDLKEILSFSPYLTRLLKGLERREGSSFLVSRNGDEYRITLQIGSTAFLDLGRYPCPAPGKSPQRFVATGMA